jgi:hypothetical protein
MDDTRTGFFFLQLESVLVVEFGVFWSLCCFQLGLDVTRWVFDVESFTIMLLQVYRVVDAVLRRVL